MNLSAPKEWPYYFCPSCNRLTPVHFMGGVKVCLKCNYTYEIGEGGKVVLFTPREARLRNLVVIKNDSTGEIEDQ